MSEGCTKPATTILFQIVGGADAIVQLPMGAFCADHLMSEKALHEKRGERMGMQVIAKDVREQTCCWLPEIEEPPQPSGDELAGRRLAIDVQALFETPARQAAARAFEERWDKVFGTATSDLRTLIGIGLGMLVRNGVHPRTVADYVRESLRGTFPSVFDSPI